jgi:hypothetical protein
MSDEITPDDLRNQWAEEDRLEIETQYRELLSTPRGRKFLFYLLGLTKFMQNPFTGNALTTSFNCGEMSIGQRLMADITSVDPIGWSRMQQEVNDADRTRSDAIRAAER